MLFYELLMMLLLAIAIPIGNRFVQNNTKDNIL